ncbi:hypothetical protein [Pseudoponticoccus marisrubri]|uniref:Uncharacterized protein n=1 Tax=Pseudoponticoccus marisrubri TaxID=1685382 RepID=A0A0W7WNW0_9RHOB|nr:hypothetical protein [Pseudoponticoccus marisrubri]KUF12225.1 hypothetical protein AVJ23_00365 [Pseudoponticoccus marisrubri]
MTRILFLVLALCGPAQLASAQSSTLSGRVALGYTDDLSGTAIGAVDLTWSLAVTRRQPLRFEIGTYLFALDGKRPHETYAAFAWNDSWRLGVVRPAYDGVLPSGFERLAPYHAYERAEYARAFTTVEAMRRTAVPWGASYEGVSGPLSFAISVHDAVKGSFRSGTVAVEYAGAGWSLAAAVEGARSRGGQHRDTNSKIGARFDVAGGAVGIAYLHPELNNRDNALALDMTLPLGDRLTLMGAAELTELHRDDAYALGMDVRLRDTLSVLVSGSDTTARGSAAHLTLETRF